MTKKVHLSLFFMAVFAANISLAADKIGGIPIADFQNGTLIVPCVKIENHSEELNGLYYDVTMQRRGNSLNYEVIFAEIEDSSVCEAVATFAIIQDEDLEHAPEP